MKGFLNRFFGWFVTIGVVGTVYTVITDNLDVLPWFILGGAIGSAILAAVVRK